MAKPAQLPRWASGAGAEITPEPTEGKKDLGWTPGEKPPAQYQNWWMRRVYEWCQYLDGLTNEALTWAAKHTFQGGAASPVMPAAANDLVNKAYADAGADSAKAYGDGLIAALKAAANAWSQRQTFNGGATVPAPVNATDAVTKTYADARETAAKTYADGLITALRAAANTWAAKQTFSAGMDVTGKLALVQAALQQILKTGGKLQVGTADANDVEFLRGNVVHLALSALGPDLKGNALNGIGLAAFYAWVGLDPISAAEGNIWHRPDLKKLRALLNGAIENLATEAYVNQRVFPAQSRVIAAGEAYTDGVLYAGAFGLTEATKLATGSYRYRLSDPGPHPLAVVSLRNPVGFPRLVGARVVAGFLYVDSSDAAGVRADAEFVVTVVAGV